MFIVRSEGTEDPFNKDEGPPLLIAMRGIRKRRTLWTAAAPQLELALAALPLGVRVTVTPMERKFYPVAGETAPAPLRAPFSYVVRYHRPAEDEAAFVANYVADHPRLGSCRASARSCAISRCRRRSPS